MGQFNYELPKLGRHQLDGYKPGQLITITPRMMTQGYLVKGPGGITRERKFTVLGVNEAGQIVALNPKWKDSNGNGI